MNLIKCKVYSVDNPEDRKFFVQVNETLGGKYYPTGEEIVLPEPCIRVLEDAVIDTMIRNPETNKAERYRKARFQVVRLAVVGRVGEKGLEEVNESESTEETKKAGRPKREI